MIPSLAAALRRLRTRFNSPPPVRGLPQSYQAEFPATAREFNRFLKCGLSLPAPDPGAPVGVVVMPWVGTPLPWFAMMLAFGLARRRRPIVFIWDDTPFPAPSDYIDLQNRIISQMLRKQARGCRIIRLSELPVSPLSPADVAQVNQLADINVQWALRGALTLAEHEPLADAMRASLSQALGRIRSLMSAETFRYLLAPGGTFGSSGLFLWLGTQHQLRVATYDAGLRFMTASPTGVAAQHFDLPRAFDRLLHAEASTRAQMVHYAEAELNNRRHARDLARYQTVASTTHPVAPSGALIPLNVEWDASALGRHTIFRDRTDWLESTIPFILENSDSHITIREHPAETQQQAAHRISFEPLHIRFGGTPRLKFVSAEAPVNTYNLVDGASIVLPFVSTIGIEAAALGKQVIVAGEPYYAGLGFVWAPKTRDQYFEWLARALSGDLSPLPEQRERALLCYYLAALGNVVWTDFTPQPQDFWNWVERAPADFFAEAALDDLLTSVDQDIPLALVRHTRQARQPLAFARE